MSKRMEFGPVTEASRFLRCLQERGSCRDTTVTSREQFVDELCGVESTGARTELARIRLAGRSGDEAWLKGRSYLPGLENGTHYNTFRHIGDTYDWLQRLPDIKVLQMVDQALFVHDPYYEKPYLLEVARRVSYLYDSRPLSIQQRALELYPELNTIGPRAWERIDDRRRPESFEEFVPFSLTDYVVE